jgi:tripartite-type tricarboxylate transporter receptor subunit TctC
MLTNLPTLKEEGVKDYKLMRWIACYLPAGTPNDAVTSMREILGNIVNTKTFVDMLTTNCIEPLELTGNALIEMNRREIENWKETFRSLNMTPAK